MLWDVGKHTRIDRIPHKREYDIWLSRLSEVQIAAIRVAILSRIENGAGEIATAGWIPGSDWTGTPFEAIYEFACLSDYEASARCLGIFVWDTLRLQPEAWAFGRYELNNLPISSMTYFRVYPDGLLNS